MCESNVNHLAGPHSYFKFTPVTSHDIKIEEEEEIEIKYPLFDS